MGDDRVTTLFLDGTELKENQLEDYRFDTRRPSVTVMLVDESQHRHISAKYHPRNVTGARPVFITASYEVLRSGALAIIRSSRPTRRTTGGAGGPVVTYAAVGSVPPGRQR